MTKYIPQVYWDEYFEVVWYKQKILNAHTICQKCRESIKNWWIITQQERGDLEFAYADMRDNLAIIKSLVWGYKITFWELKAAARKSLKGTYSTKTEEAGNIVKDAEEIVCEEYRELEEEKIYIEKIEDYIDAHLRICEFFKSSVIWERANQKRIDTLLSWKFE